MTTLESAASEPDAQSSEGLTTPMPSRILPVWRELGQSPRDDYVTALNYWPDEGDTFMILLGATTASSPPW
jgi:hypothetical protein